MPTKAKEREALRLLGEVAVERHGSRCLLVRVEMVAAQHVLEVLDFDPLASPSTPSVVSASLPFAESAASE